MADIQDDFNRTSNLNGSTTSDAQTTWVEDQGDAWTVDGDEAVFIPEEVEFGVGRLSAEMASANHYAEVAISLWSYVNNTLAAGVAVRINAAATSGYGFEVAQTGASTFSRRLYRFDTDADLVSDTTQTTTGTIRIEVSADSIIAKVNGVQVLSTTNSVHAGGVGSRGVGITGFTNAVGGSGVAFTSFRGADLAGGVTNTDRQTVVGAGTLAGVAPTRVVGVVATPQTP